VHTKKNRRDLGMSEIAFDQAKRLAVHSVGIYGRWIESGLRTEKPRAGIEPATSSLQNWRSTN
jgi:hypothetical protein